VPPRGAPFPLHHRSQRIKPPFDSFGQGFDDHVLEEFFTGEREEIFEGLGDEAAVGSLIRLQARGADLVGDDADVKDYQTLHGENLADFLRRDRKNVGGKVRVFPRTRRRPEASPVAYKRTSER
jgi:hypothetical protein